MAEGKEKRNFLFEPAVIYEVHFGSWKKQADGDLLTYREMAAELIPYVLSMVLRILKYYPLLNTPLTVLGDTRELDTFQQLRVMAHQRTLCTL